tara:strand:+ start:521 stop:1519 length:999 start_codon:yes stop_codon:yes gene_type:complete
MKEIIVTGGLGFIGSNFIQLALDNLPNTKIINIDNETYAADTSLNAIFNKNKNYTYLKIDICDELKISELFNKHNIDAVVNFAAESHVDNSISEPDIFLKTNIFGTFNLLNSLKNSINKDATFLHVSTDEVYGTLELEESAFTESNAYKPNSPYSASKASSDFLVRAWFETYKMNVITTNCSNNYGPNQNSEKLIPKIIRNAIEGQNIPIYGDGKNIRDWLFVIDHCEAIIKVLNSGNFGQTYNVGGNNEIQNLDLAYIVLDKLNHYYQIHNLQMPSNVTNFKDLIVFVEDRKGHDFRYAINCSKIKKHLNWEPRHSFEEGISKTIDWYLQN